MLLVEWSSWSFTGPCITIGRFPRARWKQRRNRCMPQTRVREETACEVECQGFAGMIRYEVDGIPKTVLFWRMSLVRQEALEPNDEITEAVWLPLSEAIARLTYQSERELVTRSSTCLTADPGTRS